MVIYAIYVCLSENDTHFSETTSWKFNILSRRGEKINYLKPSPCITLLQSCIILFPATGYGREEIYQNKVQVSAITKY